MRMAGGAVVMVVMMIVAMPGGAKTPVHHPSADDDDRDPRNSSEDADRMFRHHVLEEKQRAQPEHKHRDGMGEGDDGAQQYRVPDGAARPDQVGRDDRLPMSRRERMSGPQDERHGKRGKHHSRRDPLL